jgi:hypothetical protein
MELFGHRPRKEQNCFSVLRKFVFEGGKIEFYKGQIRGFCRPPVALFDNRFYMLHGALLFPAIPKPSRQAFAEFVSVQAPQNVFRTVKSQSVAPVTEIILYPVWGTPIH